MNKDIADFALNYAMSKKVEYAEVRAHREDGEGLTLKNGVLDAYGKAVDSGFCVRILAEGGIGFASTNKWTKEETRTIVDTAHKFAKTARRKDKIKFAKEKSVKANWKVLQKKKLADISPEARIETMVEADKTLTSLGIKIAARMFGLGTGVTEKYFVNTEGSAISSYLPRVNAYGFITVVENGKPEQASKAFGNTGGWEILEKWKIAEQISHEAEVLQRLIKEGKAVKPGKTDLICGSEVAGIAAHESCGHPMEADRILGREMSQAGRSFIYQGGPFWLGTRVGSPAVTIIDDPTVKNSYAYYEYDDEGIKARPRYLYKKGVIHEFLHNRETAAKMGTRSNGSSRALSYDREAIVRMANTFVQPGNFSQEELFEDVKQGVYMRSFTEWNIDDKRFNQRYVGREAYLIENGEIKHPLARPVIETTTKTFWSAVDAASKKIEYDAGSCGKGDPMQGIPAHMGGPHIRLREVYIR